MSLLFISPILLAMVMIVVGLRRRKRYLPLPPGPKGLPLIGNFFDMPTMYEWEKYMEWAKQYDTDILYLNVAGKSIVVLDTYEACNELLEKRSRYYSSRPPFPMAIDLMGMDFNFSFIPYGDKWRARRRLFHSVFHESASARFRPLEKKVAHRFLRSMLSAGEDGLEDMVRHMAGALVLGIAYGVDIKSDEDQRVIDARALMHMLAGSTIQGSYLVNNVPALKYVPDWMPGAGFKRVAREWRPRAQGIVDRPFEEVKKSLTDGSFPAQSFVRTTLEKGGDERAIRDAAATMYNAATDTTVTNILNFVLAILDHPEIQRRAQAELDAVLGPLQTAEGKPGQMPTFEHASQLPYTTAVVRESARYRPVVPAGVSHAYNGEQPDVYNGYAIPCDSIIIPNIWSMAHNEDIYPDSYAFKPERFLAADGTLDPNVPDPAKIVFGFGRRACPGRHMAYDSVWLMLASILRVYNIEKVKRPDGTVIEPRREWLSSLIQVPKPFKCAFAPRSSAAEAMIRSTEAMEY
ncbi:cytochrome P450 [Schizophyllum commune]